MRLGYWSFMNHHDIGHGVEVWLHGMETANPGFPASRLRSVRNVEPLASEPRLMRYWTAT